MSKGVVLIANNNGTVDYVKQAIYCAGRIKKYLNLPVTLITDSEDYVSKIAHDVFDKVKKGELPVFYYRMDTLEKIKELHPEAEVVLRIKTHDEKSVIQFSKKFGAHEENWETIIKKCKEMNLNFIGVSFHVGTGSYEPNTFIRAIEDASSIFKMATKYGFNLHLLDIGGGFPGFDDTTPSFEEFAEAVNSSIKLYFGEYKNLRVISEPGRFFVEQSQYLITKIVSRNILEENQISEATEILESIKISDDSDNEDNIRGQYRNKYFIRDWWLRTNKKSAC